MILSIFLQPKASKNEIVGWYEDELKVRIKAPPVEGKANQELLRFLAKHLGLATTELCLMSGQTSRHKRVEIPLPETFVLAQLPPRAPSSLQRPLF